MHIRALSHQTIKSQKSQSNKKSDTTTQLVVVSPPVVISQASVEQAAKAKLEYDQFTKAAHHGLTTYNDIMYADKRAYIKQMLGVDVYV